MADNSGIEWTEATWNPTTGCDRTSPGCDHCYAITLARRLKVARSTIQARLERLETTGIIVGYTVKLGEAARAGRLRTTVLLTIEPRAQAAILTRLKSIPEVERIHTTSGRVDLGPAVGRGGLRRPALG